MRIKKIEVVGISLLIACLAGYVTPAQTLFGTTRTGGTTGGGTIFRVNPDGTGFSIDYNFQIDNNAGKRPDYCQMVKLPNGKLYGVTPEGGKTDTGVLYEYDPTTNIYTKKIDFDDQLLKGRSPYGTLAYLGSSGKLYGLTREGGANDDGVLFEYDPVTNALTKKADFEETTIGAFSLGGLTLASNGKFYGMTLGGGATGQGALFEYDPVGNTIIKIIDFNGTPKGSVPLRDLRQAANGKLYGMTVTGGTNDRGVLFEYDPATAGFVKKVDFGGALGEGPIGSLLLASNGKFYGTAGRGGTSNDGVFFEYDPSGAGTYTKKADFDYATTGSNPGPELVQLANGKIYGTTESGGLFNIGVLFEYVINSTLTKKIDFNFANGNIPKGGLTLANNGNIYGTTTYSGAYDMGILYEYNPTTFIISTKIDFNVSTNGANPENSMVATPNGKLYGTTQLGGTKGLGVLFEYDPIAKVLTNKFEFSDWNLYGANPIGKLSLANNGKLYGVAYNGGVNGGGVLFEYDYLSNVYSKKIDFAFSEGVYPFGGLILASNGKLYGMASEGGTYSKGVLFEFDPALSLYTRKIDFEDTNGAFPHGDLMQASNGKVYGMTAGGGANNFGVLFDYDVLTNTLTKQVDFDGAQKGDSPYGGLIQATNGKLYGMTSGGGASLLGVLFEFDPVGNVYVKKKDLDGNGGVPKGTFSRGTGGKLLGLMGMGGANNSGTLFEYDPATNTLTTKTEFIGSNGAFPEYGSMVSLDTSPPVLTSSSAALSGTNVNVTTSFSDAESGITGVKITYRAIASTGSFPTPVAMTASGANWTFSIPSTAVDELGVEYKMEATNGIGLVLTTPLSSYKNPFTAGLSIPYASFGSDVSNYRIISVPLDLTAKTVTDVFADDLGTNDIKKWRMYRYASGTTSELSPSTSIDAGKGYWLIVKTDPGKAIATGAGQAVQTTSDVPFSIALENGFTQIGNPYNFNLSWADVQAANTGLGAIRLYTGDFVDGTRLNKMEGGFVFSATGGTLKFPVGKNASVNGRQATTEQKEHNAIDNNDWEVDFMVEQGSMRNLISGFGMNTKASDAYDALDGITLPRCFDEYLELNHSKSVNRYTFSKDIVSPNGNHTWQFSLASSLEQENITITWDNSYFGSNDRQLVLWDEQAQRGIDMKRATSYSFTKNQAGLFRVVYGSEEYVKQETTVDQLVFHSVSPNPSEGDVTISFSLPQESQSRVMIQAVDMLGRSLWKSENLFTSGYHEVVWKRDNREAKGLYLIQVKTANQARQMRLILK